MPKGTSGLTPTLRFDKSTIVFQPMNGMRRNEVPMKNYSGYRENIFAFISETSAFILKRLWASVGQKAKLRHRCYEYPSQKGFNQEIQMPYRTSGLTSLRLLVSVGQRIKLRHRCYEYPSQKGFNQEIQMPYRTSGLTSRMFTP